MSYNFGAYRLEHILILRVSRYRSLHCFHNGRMASPPLVTRQLTATLTL